ncbi:unnamed protein product [Durusdinium trenchii]|uniref:Uncharacterized protein n=1 Tax=Durusdinium trenchii TaxID=1381693 RepID=A0ABP0Q1W5_9DINO
MNQAHHGIVLGAAGRDARPIEMAMPGMPHRRMAPKPPDVLRLGGEPTAPLHTGEVVPRLDRCRMAQGVCRPHHRLEPGGASSLQNVPTDFPPCCRAPGEPPSEKLQLLLHPRQQVRVTHRAHLPIPMPTERQARRLRGAPASAVQEFLLRPEGAELLRPISDEWPPSPALKEGRHCLRCRRLRCGQERFSLFAPDL